MTSKKIMTLFIVVVLNWTHSISEVCLYLMNPYFLEEIQPEIQLTLII